MIAFKKVTFRNIRYPVEYIYRQRCAMVGTGSESLNTPNSCETHNIVQLYNAGRKHSNSCRVESGSGSTLLNLLEPLYTNGGSVEVNNFSGEGEK